MRSIRLALLLSALAVAGGSTFAQAKAPTVRSLIVCSELVVKDSAYARNLNDWSKRFVTLLTVKCGVPAGNVRVLGPVADAKATPPVGECTLAGVQAAFAALAKELGPDDQFILVTLGYGAVTDPVAKLCLVGPDLKATTLAEMLDALPTRKVVVLNFSSGGQEFIEKYARAGRVVVTACGKTREGGQCYFPEFFLTGYESGKSDLNGDGTITLLEAFEHAGRQCINWYHHQYRIDPPKDLPPDQPPPPRKVEVRTPEARRLFQKFYAGVPDLEMVMPVADEDDAADPKIEGIEDLPLRREALEHASLEDRGDANGAALEWAENKHRALTGKEGEQGSTAARTVLGSPILRPAVE